jgi:hypothetical protein
VAAIAVLSKTSGAGFACTSGLSESLPVSIINWFASNFLIRPLALSGSLGSFQRLTNVL